MTKAKLIILDTDKIFDVKKSEVLLVSDRPQLLTNAKSEGFKVITFSDWFESAERIKKFTAKANSYAALSSGATRYFS